MKKIINLISSKDLWLYAYIRLKQDQCQQSLKLKAQKNPELCDQKILFIFFFSSNLRTKNPKISKNIYINKIRNKTFIKFKVEYQEFNVFRVILTINNNNNTKLGVYT